MHAAWDGIHIMTSPLSQPITVCTAVITRLGHALCNHPACHEHNATLNAHVLLHCRLKISSLQMSLLWILWGLSQFIYTAKHLLHYTPVWKLCVMLWILQISCADLVPSLTHCIPLGIPLGRPEQIRVTCPSILLYSKATFHNLLIT